MQSFSGSFSQYLDVFGTALRTIEPHALESATAILDQLYRNDNTLFVIGNGQSATTATAFALDLTKQTAPPPPKRRFRVISLSDNTAALTAWANDVSYESIFTEQLKGLARPGDVLMPVSASGNSPNLIHACKWMRDNGGKVVSLAGFKGGAVRDLSDACVVVYSTDYGHIETAHIAIMHYWVDLFRERLAQ
jgi:D-sedoheptulose 7-phosphate isomerase